MEIQRIDTNTIYLIENLFDQYRIFYQQASNMELARQFLYQRLLNNESIIFAAIDHENGQPIATGFTQLYPLYSSVRATKNWILNDLFVDKNYRKQGVGRKLIEVAIRFAKDQGATFIQLETTPENSTAQRLYEAMGFQQYNPFEGELVYKINL